MKKTIRKLNQKRGFTLIELLVVLAIVGILIALAIVGLRAAQATQRDTARKIITSQINALLQSYLSINNGVLPTSGAGGSFYSTTATTAFIQNPGTGCKGITVNGSCVGLDGLTMVTPLWPVAATCAPTTISFSQMTLCYGTGGGAAQYILGIYLESTNAAYMVAS